MMTQSVATALDATGATTVHEGEFFQALTVRSAIRNEEKTWVGSPNYIAFVLNALFAEPGLYTFVRCESHVARNWA